MGLREQAVLAILMVGLEPALAQTAPPGPVLEARITKAVRALENEPRFKGLSEQQRRDRIEFVAGNVLFALVHEVGHMLIAEMGLPVLGREEDAADAFATLTGLKMGDSFSDRVLEESARGWFLSDLRSQKEKTQTASVGPLCLACSGSIGDAVLQRAGRTVGSFDPVDCRLL